MFRSVFLRRVTFEKLLFCGSVSQLQTQCTLHSAENVFKQTDETKNARAKEKYVKESYYTLPVSHTLVHENERKMLLSMCAAMKELDPHVALPVALASKMIALHIVEGKYVEVLHILTTHPHLEELTKQVILELESSYASALTPTVILQLLEILTCAEVHYIEEWLVLFAECVAEQKFNLLQQSTNSNNNSNIIIIYDRETTNDTDTNYEVQNDNEENYMESKPLEKHDADAVDDTVTSLQKKESDKVSVPEQNVKILEKCRRKLHDSIMRLVKVQPLSHYPAILLRAICQVSDGTRRSDREDVLYVLQMALNASNLFINSSRKESGSNNVNGNTQVSNSTNDVNTLNTCSSVLHAGVFIDPDHFRNVLQVIVEDGKDYRRAAILWKWMRHSSACWDSEAVSSAVIAYVNLRELSEAIECLQTLAEVNVNPTIQAQVALLTYLTERTPAMPHYANKLVEHWYGVCPRAYWPDFIVESNTSSNNINNENSRSNSVISNTNNVNVNANQANGKINTPSNALQINSKIWFGAAQQVGQCLIYLHFRLRNHENVLQLLRDAAYALMTQWHSNKNICNGSVRHCELEKLICAEQQQQKQQEQQQKHEALCNIINFVQGAGMAYVFRHFAKDIAFNPLMKECFHDMPVEYALLDNKPYLIGALIIIEREVSAIKERHARDATTKITNATDEEVKIEDANKDSDVVITTTNTTTTTTAPVNENKVACEENKDLLQEEENGQNKESKSVQAEQKRSPSNQSIYKRLASVVIDDIGFAELARFLADEQNSRFSPVERLHLIRTVALHLRCNVPREVQGWLELLGSDDANNHDANVSVSEEVNQTQ